MSYRHQRFNSPYAIQPYYQQYANNIMPYYKTDPLMPTGSLNTFDIISIKNSNDVTQLSGIVKQVMMRGINQSWFQKESQENKTKLINILQMTYCYNQHGLDYRNKLLLQMHEEISRAEKLVEEKKVVVKQLKMNCQQLKDEENAKRKTLKQYKSYLQSLHKCLKCNKFVKNISAHKARHDNYDRSAASSHNNQTLIMEQFKKIEAENQNILNKFMKQNEIMYAKLQRQYQDLQKNKKQDTGTIQTIQTNQTNQTLTKIQKDIIGLKNQIYLIHNEVKKYPQIAGLIDEKLRPVIKKIEEVRVPSLTLQRTTDSVVQPPQKSNRNISNPPQLGYSAKNFPTSKQPVAVKYKSVIKNNQTGESEQSDGSAIKGMSFRHPSKPNNGFNILQPIPVMKNSIEVEKSIQNSSINFDIPEAGRMSIVHNQMLSSINEAYQPNSGSVNQNPFQRFQSQQKQEQQQKKGQQQQYNEYGNDSFQQQEQGDIVDPAQNVNYPSQNSNTNYDILPVRSNFVEQNQTGQLIPLPVQRNLFASLQQSETHGEQRERRPSELDPFGLRRDEHANSYSYNIQQTKQNPPISGLKSPRAALSNTFMNVRQQDQGQLQQSNPYGNSLGIPSRVDQSISNSVRNSPPVAFQERVSYQNKQTPEIKNSKSNELLFEDQIRKQYQKLFQAKFGNLGSLTKQQLDQRIEYIDKQLKIQETELQVYHEKVIKLINSQNSQNADNITYQEKPVGERIIQSKIVPDKKPEPKVQSVMESKIIANHQPQMLTSNIEDDDFFKISMAQSGQRVNSNLRGFDKKPKMERASNYILEKQAGQYDSEIQDFLNPALLEHSPSNQGSF